LPQFIARLVHLVSQCDSAFLSVPPRPSVATGSPTHRYVDKTVEGIASSTIMDWPGAPLLAVMGTVDGRQNTTG